VTEPAGRVVVLTGGTSGIGRAAARALAGEATTLVLVARDAARARETLGEIRAAKPDARVECFTADLAVQRSIRDVAGAILARFPRIDVLVNNAGVVNLRRATTPDGIEAVLAVNHLAYFMLTVLLMDALRCAPAARVVSVASEAHRMGRLDLDDLGYARRRYRALQVYGQSKLLNLLFTYALARRLTGTPITVNCLHPGAVATRLGQQNGRIATFLTKLLRPFFRTPEEGADTLVYLANSPDVAGKSGGYYANRKSIRSTALTYDESVQERLWVLSEELTGVRWQS
jgi:NAD(P)-dependent dehydrogenase (short-subunit alcohol dehydrogenase family)